MLVRSTTRQLMKLLMGPTWALVLASSAIATVTLGTGHGGHHVSGGSDGVGGIPYAGGLQPSTAASVQYLATLGAVVDGAEVAQSRVPVVVTTSQGALVAVGITDDAGLFTLDLP